jgi:hypothetical protein
MKNTTILFNYSLADISLLRLSIVNDLGVWFDAKLSFNDYLYFVRNKAFAKLGFLKRTCANFRDQFALKTLHQSIVRSHFDHALLIWHPYLKTSILSLEKVQNNFIRFLCFQCFIFRIPHSSYEVESSIFNIFTLENRFLQIIKFLYKILKNMIDCPEILQNLHFKINSKNCRKKNLFYIKNVTTSYMSNSPSNVLMLARNYVENIDFFNTSLTEFSVQILRYIK